MQLRPVAGLILVLLLCAVAATGVQAAPSDGPGFDQQPWIEDLEQARLAFSTRYADLQWEVFGHDLDLSAAFNETRLRLERAHSEAEAQAAFNDLARQFGNRHVRFQWRDPRHASELARGGVSCSALGYSAAMQARPLATLMPGVSALADLPDKKFPAGYLFVAKRKIGLMQIPIFTPRGFPDLCEAAISGLKIDRTKSCDESCSRSIEAWAADRLTRDLKQALEHIKAARVDALLIDISGNGGGSEWVEAAARMLTSIRLKSTPMSFMRGEHWAKRLARKEDELRAAAKDANDEDRLFLTHLADLVQQRERDAQQPCDGEPLWSRKQPDCTWLGDGFYSTGLLQSASADALRHKSWASLVFTPAQYPYNEGVWRGPLFVLVDSGTGSAAEQFAAELQDNRAAVVLGSPTVGAGCGHTDGGTPTTLRNSGAVLSLPDCVRTRPDGSNLASGIQPDALVGLRQDDSMHRKAMLLKIKLEEVLLQERKSSATR
jgi:hypothetical protein